MKLSSLNFAAVFKSSELMKYHLFFCIKRNKGHCSQMQFACNATYTELHFRFMLPIEPVKPVAVSFRSSYDVMAISILKFAHYFLIDINSIWTRDLRLLLNFLSTFCLYGHTLSSKGSLQRKVMYI
jgi:hypothetical protein